MSGIKKIIIIQIILIVISTVSNAQERDLNIAQIFNKVSKSVVKVYAIDFLGIESSQGSGVVIDNGIVVTNYHVFDGNEKLEIEHFGERYTNIKILFADYDEGYVIIELFGEWNDAVENDIMTFKREIVEHLMLNGISKFILIAENVLNFHSSDDCYYEEWFEEVEDKSGWIAFLNLRKHVLEEMQSEDLDQFFIQGGDLEDVEWRTMNPRQFYKQITHYVEKRLG